MKKYEKLRENWDRIGDSYEPKKNILANIVLITISCYECVGNSLEWCILYSDIAALQLKNNEKKNMKNEKFDSF